MHPTTTTSPDTTTVPHERLHGLVAERFRAHGVPERRADLAASALCHGDLCGFDSHGVFNLPRLYLPLLESGRADPAAEPVVRAELGACATVDAGRALGLWAAAELMDDAIARAREHGVGLVSVRGATHFGCAGFHAARAAEQGMIGVVASNCGGQRIARPPLGAVPLLGTNPLAVSAPALPGHPFLLDMSTTVVPTGKVRVAAGDGAAIPEGWLADDSGAAVTDPSAFDGGTAHLRWLGGDPDTGAHKGFGLGLVVELLAALLSGSALGPTPEAVLGDAGRDDDIGYFLLAIDAERLRPGFAEAARTMFGAVLDCPPEGRVHYPGWQEAERANQRRRDGVPVRTRLLAELGEVAG
ncbi:Ldh family oxidoreductase [Saccharopolyspora flava]|uniref:Malate/lactate/ureidoglycolate dehydrogenase, LDH2 family n=1 Tax=Saccharopolyspora flava TaxID=95161 RepID=A0A1I6S7X2_9PSEU|nr:Ldh family oxidoreductase [Saccharopolyspora flava]SFS73047.1 Malate/lactate/ureidoglycolate dehydrogenase, LDH2 family [Saccharopolyspora flava]